MTTINIDQLCEEMKRQHGSPIVSRSEARRFTGGAISPGYLANLDSQGKGPAGRFKVGRKTVYLVDQFCRWLVERATVEG